MHLCWVFKKACVHIAFLKTECECFVFLKISKSNERYALKRAGLDPIKYDAFYNIFYLRFKLHNQVTQAEKETVHRVLLVY